MIKNTDAFFKKAKEYQDKRAQIMTKYENDMQKLEVYKGSEGYSRDIKALQDTRDADLKALKDEYRPGFMTTLDGMTEAIGKRTVSAPTNDQSNLLNALRMRKKVSRSDLQRVAETVKDNPIALGIVTEISHDQGYPYSYDHLCKELSSEKASEIVDGLRSGLEDFMSYDTKKISRLEERYQADLYGQTGNALVKRDLFSDREGCFREIGGIGADTLTLLSDVVDV